MNISIFCSSGSVVPFHNGWSVLGVVPEVEDIAALGHVDDVFPLQNIIRCSTVDGVPNM